MFAAATMASGSALVNVKLPLLSYVSVLMLPAGVCELTLRLAAAMMSSGSALVNVKLPLLSYVSVLVLPTDV